MANEFKIRKGLIVEGASGGTVVDVQGSQGQLFSVTDNLSGSIFAVSDISGVPILDVNSSGISYFDGSVGIGIDNPNSKLHVLDGVAGTYTPDSESDTLVIESDTPGGISLIGTGAGSNSKQSITFGTTSDVTSARIIYNSNNSVLSIGTTTASNYLKLQSGNGATALTLDASQNAIFTGNVGIGITNPYSVLDVNSAISSSSVDVITLTQATNGNDKPAASFGLSIQNGGETTNAADLWFTTATGGSLTEKMRISSAGAIKFNAYGAGTLVTDASGNITVSSGGGAGGPYLPLSAGSSYPLTGELVGTTATFSGGGNTLLLKKGTGTPALAFAGTATDPEASGLIEGIAGGGLRFYTSNGGTIGTPAWSSKLTISAAGNAAFTGSVGIGLTTTPGAKLQINTADERGSMLNSTVTDKLIYAQVNAHSSTSGVNTGAAAIELVGQADASAHGRHVWIGAEGVLGDTFNTKLKFKIRGIAGGYDWAGSAEAPTIMTMEGKSGNVGIGVTDPASKLEVAGVVTIKGSGTGTSGSLAIQDDYDNDNHLANIGWIRSSGGVYLSYGLKQDGSADWKSTYANFSGERTYAKLDNNEFSMSYAPAQNTAVGTVVTNITEKFKFYLNTGVLQLNSYSAGILSTNSSGTVGIASSGDLPGGPYLPLSAGSGERVTGDLYIDNNLYMRPSSTYGDGYKVMDVTGTGNAPYPTILSFSNYGRSSVMVLNDDKVGIGTTTPGSKLELSEVSGAAPTLLTLHQTAVDIVADDTMGSFIDFKSTDVNANFTPQARIGMLIRDSNGDNGIISEGCGNLVFHTSRGTDSAGAGEDVERMRITDIGNVGIGTSTPNAKLDIQGTQGQLFSVTDDLSGDIFSVADISGVPIMNVNSNGTSYFDGTVEIGTSTVATANAAADDLWLRSTGSNGITISSGNAQTGTIFFGDVANAAAAGFRYNHNTGDMAISAEDNITFACDNVGIGTTSPTSYGSTSRTLEVRGASGTGTGLVRVSAADNSVAGALYASSGGVVLNAQTNNSLSFATNNNEKMRITSTGNVGIGVTNPGVKLDVVGTVRSYSSAGNYGQIANGSFQAVGAHGGTFMLDLDNTSTADLVNIKKSGSSRFYIQNGGNVGIGTASPDYKLEVNGTLGVNRTDGIIFAGSAGSGYGNKITADASNDLIFSTSLPSAPYTVSQRMRIANNGDIGIGGNAPSYLLDVRDGTLSGAIARFSAINPHVIIESSTAGNSVLHFKPNATSSKSGQFKVTAGNGYNFKWTNDAAGTGETIYMDLDTSTTGGGDLTVKGDIIAYGAPSDKKYKENIKPIESALDKAMQLQGVTFDWKDSESILDIKEDIGFIAQDVEKVLPELVRDSGKGNLSLRYQGITPVLLEAIKELKAEIDLLKSKPCNCNKCNCNI